MKKFLITLFVFVVLTVLTVSISFAAWKIVPSAVGHTSDRHMFRWKITCTSDGSALTATDLLALMLRSPLRIEVQRSVLMIMDIDPGDDSVAPNDPFTVSIYNAEGMLVFATTTGDAESTITGIDMSEDWNQYIPVHERLYLGITDIGSDGDKVIIYIEGWIPEGR